MRGKTISKYSYRRRHKAIGIAKDYKKTKGFKGSDKLYMLYSERGQNGKGNFLTYVHRVKKEFPNDPVDAPIKIIWSKFVGHLRSINLEARKRNIIWVFVNVASIISVCGY